tara:strand:+ start:1541 stop:2656 length:1116 start_codon:yes stop_codon:yes gene_type:complete
MANINFKQPKFIIPIIILPFLVLINLAFAKFAPNEEVDNLQTTAGINSEIPDPMLDSKKEKNKLEAFRDHLLEKRKHSNTKVVGEELEERTRNEVISPEEQRKIDSLQSVIRERRESYAAKRTEKAARNRKRTVTPSGSRKTKTKVETSSEQSEKDAFIAQMRIIDSIQNPDKYQNFALTKKEEDTKEEVQRISLNQNKDSDYFNTVKRKKDETHIMALLDEGVKVYDGSRVRIRLLQDIFINDYLLKKGKYVYGQVSGFESQRVKITINSIMMADSIVPVKISLYDNDGIKGLYVPDSQFRAFVSDLGVNAARSGGTMGNSMGQGEERTTQQLYRSVSNSINSATRAISKALKKNKAFLKYNTQVYLINE